MDDVLNHFADKVKTKGGTSEEITRVCNIAKRMLTETSMDSYAEYIKTCLPYCATNPYNAKFISRCVKNEEVAYHYNRNELTTFNFLPDLKKIECQTLVIAGDQNPIHTAKSALKTAEALQKDKVTFKIFCGAGSPVYADKETEVIELINDYLDELSVKYMEENTNNQCADSVILPRKTGHQHYATIPELARSLNP
ncbi:MAG: alpha/beta hydrolase [Nitrosopumilus sp.]|nr:alpha/beta hydrolase [Nitrosopumilus sp.]